MKAMIPHASAKANPATKKVNTLAPSSNRGKTIQRTAVEATSGIMGR